LIRDVLPTLESPNTKNLKRTVGVLSCGLAEGWEDIDAREEKEERKECYSEEEGVCMLGWKTTAKGEREDRGDLQRETVEKQEMFHFKPSNHQTKAKRQ
jgi:hypothetical protein